MLLCSTNEVLVQKPSLLSYAFPMHYFPMPCNMYPTFRDYKASTMCCHFFRLKRNQKPLAFAKHSHWSEGSLKLTCHQRKPHFLSSFLSLSSMKRSLMGTRIYHKKEFRISPWPFQKATSSTSSHNITFHKTQCLKKPRTAENTCYCFSKNTLSLNVRKL